MGRDGDGVTAASKSSIEITFVYKGTRCRERLQLEPTTANLKKAARHRTAILVAIEQGTFDYAVTFPNSKNCAKFAKQPGDVQGVETYLNDWLLRQRKVRKASTYNGYRKVVSGHLIPWFGGIMLSEIKKRDVRARLDALEGTNKTLSNIQSVLRKALADAVDDELIDANPLANWCYKRNEAPKEDDTIDPFTPEEQASILAALDGQGRNLIQFAFWTGMRTSELVALEWGDVDWLRNTVMVQRAMTQAADDAEVPKTKAGRREIKLLEGALLALQAQKAFTWLAGQHVFQNPRTSQPWTGDQPIRKTLWTHALRRAGVRYRNPYQTRHTYASMMLSAGEHPMWVATQMGHTDWTMIARVYGRWMPTADEHAGDKAEAIFGIGETKSKTLTG